MFTNKTFKVPSFPRPIPADADWRQELEAIKRQDYELRRYIQQFFRDLNAPGALGIVQRETWTPTISAGSGTITTSSASGTYHAIGALKFFTAQIDITTNGTGGSSVIFTLPTVATRIYTFAGREATVGKQLQAMVTAAGVSTVQVVNYDNTYPGADGNVLRVSGFYD